MPILLIRPRSFRPKSTSMLCSASSLVLCNKSCSSARSSSSVAPRRREPANGKVKSSPLVRRVSVSGEEPASSTWSPERRTCTAMDSPSAVSCTYREGFRLLQPCGGLPGRPGKYRLPEYIPLPVLRRGNRLPWKKRLEFAFYMQRLRFSFLSCPQELFHHIQRHDGAIIILRCRIETDVDDEVNFLLQMIEYDDLVEQHEVEIVEAVVIGCLEMQCRFCIFDEIVRKYPTRPPVKGGMPAIFGALLSCRICEIYSCGWSLVKVTSVPVLIWTTPSLQYRPICGS